MAILGGENSTTEPPVPSGDSSVPGGGPQDSFPSFPLPTHPCSLLGTRHWARKHELGLTLHVLTGI